MGLIGFKKGVNIRNALVIEELMGNGIKLQLVSKDPMVDNKTDYNALHIFGDAQPVYVTGTSDREVEVSLKRCLKSVIERREQLSAESLVPSHLKARKRKETSHQSDYKKQERFESEKDGYIRKIENDELNSVFYHGEALEYVLRDPTLGKLFVTLCSMSRVAVGSEITVVQKRDLTKLLRSYAKCGQQGYVMALISEN